MANLGENRLSEIRLSVMKRFKVSISDSGFRVFPKNAQVKISFTTLTKYTFISD